ncbi:hypothetical protein LB456_09205 [Psychroflexus sp. CAK57W]|uniref:hypothetical protein n=1 Tax=Psychroflexus curvus TaxID=2873595 RepID=UPI001CCA19BA|nr:hypothetical protein [Psychroflexus curvus]MBZ9627933.1 hypothetical protein [Psychroflexus curvus]MBZ9787632.1 hypothetical protein [Psychroflexus curvus]
MKKQHIILFWASGLFLGLMVCAYFACPLWKVAVPVMLFLSIATGVTGYNQLKKPKDS